MRICILSAYNYWGRFDPERLYKETEGEDIQIGGGETAMLQIARSLAQRGHETFLFYDINDPRKIEGVEFLPTAMSIPFITNVQHDVLVSWDAPGIFRFADRARARFMAFQLNTTTVGVYDQVIDRYLHPSLWHAERYSTLYPEIDKKKQLSRITNGIDFTRYQVSPKVMRDPHRVIYSSSPDRGLHHLLRFWPRVVEQVPDAELHVYYDFATWLHNDAEAKKVGLHLVTSDRADELRRYIENPPEGVIFHGGIGQWELAKAQLKCSTMCYPCDPVQPTEGFSMTILEGIAAGLNVLTTDADAFGELWSDQPGVTMLPLPVNDDLWVAKLVESLHKPPREGPQLNLAFSWAHLAERWEKEMLLCLRSPSR